MKSIEFQNRIGYNYRKRKYFAASLPAAPIHTVKEGGGNFYVGKSGFTDIFTLYEKERKNAVQGKV